MHEEVGDCIEKDKRKQKLSKQEEDDIYIYRFLLLKKITLRKAGYDHGSG